MPDAAKTRELVIGNPNGLHARPASMFVATARRFRAEISVLCGGRCADGRSVLSLLTLAAAEGTPITIRACGDDASEALAALGALVEAGFTGHTCP